MYILCIFILMIKHFNLLKKKKECFNIYYKENYVLFGLEMYEKNFAVNLNKTQLSTV